MKVIRTLKFILMLVFVFALALPVFAQGGEGPVFGSSFIDGSVISWVGWIVAVILGVLLLFAVRELAAQGNKSAELGLRFFEAGRDMIPINAWQLAYERRAAETPTMLDDMVAKGTRAGLEYSGVIPPKEVSEPGSTNEAPH